MSDVSVGSTMSEGVAAAPVSARFRSHQSMNQGASATVIIHPCVFSFVSPSLRTYQWVSL